MKIIKNKFLNENFILLKPLLKPKSDNNTINITKNSKEKLPHIKNSSSDINSFVSYFTFNSSNTTANTNNNSNRRNNSFQRYNYCLKKIKYKPGKKLKNF